MQQHPRMRERGEDTEPLSGTLACVVAIVRTQSLDEVERRLKDLRVPGVSVSRVTGFGEYKNFFEPDWLSGHARVEIFVHAARADEIAGAILEAAHTGTPGDGLIAIVPVDTVYRVRTGERVESGDLGGCECIGDGCKIAAERARARARGTARPAG